MCIRTWHSDIPLCDPDGWNESFDKTYMGYYTWMVWHLICIQQFLPNPSLPNSIVNLRERKESENLRKHTLFSCMQSWSFWTVHISTLHATWGCTKGKVLFLIMCQEVHEDKTNFKMELSWKEELLIPRLVICLLWLVVSNTLPALFKYLTVESGLNYKQSSCPSSCLDIKEF